MVCKKNLQAFFAGAIVASSQVYAKNITLENFGLVGDQFTTLPLHSWYALTDPVMGGQSTGTVTAGEGLGIFEGQVKTVPSLNSPGFIAMQTRGGFWPDLNSCQGLEITVMSGNDYNGFKVSFGTEHVTNNSPFARGYKTPFSPGVGQYTDVMIPFTAFSDNWDAATGDINVSCEDDKDYCPDKKTLKDMQRFEIMAEGVNGQIDLKVRRIAAIGCDDDVVEVDPNPDQNLRPGRGQGGPFGGRDHDDVEFVGNIKPKILKNGDVRIEEWSDPIHAWYTSNDPVMGGQSTSTVTVESDTILFDGEVVDVPFLSEPGFIKMTTRGGEFPDVSHCRALKLNLKSPLSYRGLFVEFGVHRAEGASRFARGYKAPLNVQRSDSFQSVVIPFTEFSDSWDIETGKVKVRCLESSIHCPDEATLRYFTILSIMAQGVDGKVHLEIKSIDATDCEYEKKGSSGWGYFFAVVASLLFGVFLGRRTSVYGFSALISRRDTIDRSFENNEVGVEVAKIAPPSPITSLRRQAETTKMNTM